MASEAKKPICPLQNQYYLALRWSVVFVSIHFHAYAVKSCIFNQSSLINGVNETELWRISFQIIIHFAWNNMKWSDDGAVLLKPSQFNQAIHEFRGFWVNFTSNCFFNELLFPNKLYTATTKEVHALFFSTILKIDDAKMREWENNRTANVLANPSNASLFGFCESAPLFTASRWNRLIRSQFHSSAS